MAKRKDISKLLKNGKNARFKRVFYSGKKELKEILVIQEVLGSRNEIDFYDLSKMYMSDPCKRGYKFFKV